MRHLSDLDIRPRARGADTTAALLERWSSRSLATCWPATAEEWRGPATDALVHQLGARRRSPTLLAAARALGEHRAIVGTRLHEARADVAILLDLVHTRGRTRTEVFEAFTVGWAEAAVERLAALPAVDERSDMATLAYLRIRLRELYRELGPEVPDEFLLVLAETDPVPQRIVAETRLATLHSALECSFVCGESIVAVSDRRVAVLASRDEPNLSASMMLLAHELDVARVEDRLPVSRTWRQGLPRRVDELSLTLLGVAD